MSDKATLVIMAAGMGSRYGGLKQIDPVGPNGEIIMEYSIYDALKAGFGKVVFIIKRDMEETFRELIGKKIEGLIDVEYVYQKVDNLPQGFSLPEGRVKPWGTGHAVLSAKDAVKTPFAVINADDFYGANTYKLLSDFLSSNKDSDDKYKYCMVGFIIENTLTENGHVARGVCNVDSEGNLIDIHERTKIMKFDKEAKYTEDDRNWMVIPENSIVSMNTWGFNQSIFDELEKGFPVFLNSSMDNLLKAEYFLPTVVDRLIKEGKADVKVLSTTDKWYGVTYQEDKQNVKKSIGDMVSEGKYPMNLWGK
ncbi:dTDP-glucose pyrophosphorylase [Ruminiclostridium sufflavum DSM 19573]|uniref:dTDP-glucose pyrophosphorylase n=1 Tax=Ruminiclostridium sufflavum DSM 19573 TaxID=1121337 RepID=A0A318XMV2_9FIRM|nr:sugar phosphate nucleotidyltransferase [Ruminiclostridium sufflavum]PYG88149.1 dTDP-glucose pyrophosphorylase [Ruminiclostridium sufflavum DSM 19573]